MEAVPLLYSHNVFGYSAPGTLLNFSATAAPTNLNSIRYLTLSLFWHAWFPYSSVEDLRNNRCPPRFRFEWKRACDILAGMEALQELRINIGFSWENHHKAALTENIWFEHLARVDRQGLRKFDVGVNWPGPAVEGQVVAVEVGEERLGVEELPFRLFRRPESGLSWFF